MSYNLGSVSSRFGVKGKILDLYYYFLFFERPTTAAEVKDSRRRPVLFIHFTVFLRRQLDDPVAFHRPHVYYRVQRTNERIVTRAGAQRRRPSGACHVRRFATRTQGVKGETRR